MDSVHLELLQSVTRVKEVSMPFRSTVIAGVATIGIGALTVSPGAPPAHAPQPPTFSKEVQLTAAATSTPAALPPLGSIPLAFIRNQLQYCSLICPFAVQGAITVPLAALEAPGAFLGSLASTGSPLQALGAAAASVTGAANAAITPLINNDVFLVVPKAFHALDVAVVEGFNVAAAVFTPGQFLQAVETARSNILNALNQPVGTPTTPTGATNIFQVVSVGALDVTTAIAFQAGELLLSGAVQIADASTQELAKSGNPVAALAAGIAETRQVAATAGAPVVSAVGTALTNLQHVLHDPFPAAAKTTVTTDEPKQVEATAAETRSSKKDSERSASADSSSAAAADTQPTSKHEQKDNHPAGAKHDRPANHAAKKH
jgi:hypothetical protein